MKSFTAVGAVLGAVGLLLSPQVMAVLNGTQIFWLLMVALFCALLGESIIPALRKPADKLGQDLRDDEPPINDQ